MNDFSHIPAPSEATWVGEWHLFEGSCDPNDWVRHFGGRSWTVEISGCDPVAVDIAGTQFSDGSIEKLICVDGDVPLLYADEALMLATTLSQAAEELERIHGGSR